MAVQKVLESHASGKPKLAVFKFSSCDGCQLQLLNLEDELLDLAGAVEIAYFLEARRRELPPPLRYRPGRGEHLHARGRGPHPARPPRLQIPGRHRGLRHLGRHSGPAQLGQHRRVCPLCLPQSANS